MWLAITFVVLASMYLIWRDRWLYKHRRFCHICGVKILLHRCPACGEPWQEKSTQLDEIHKLVS